MFTLDARYTPKLVMDYEGLSETQILGWGGMLLVKTEDVLLVEVSVRFKQKGFRIRKYEICLQFSLWSMGWTHVKFKAYVFTMTVFNVCNEEC